MESMDKHFEYMDTLKEKAIEEEEEEGKEEEKEDRRPAGRRVCAVIFSLGDWPGAAGVSFPLPLVWSSAVASVFFCALAF